MNGHPEGNVLRSPGLNRLEDQGDEVDVSAIHATILREKAEPKEGFEPLSVWLVVLTGALLFWGGFYLQRYSGNFQSLVYDETASGLPAPAAAPAPGGAADLAKGKQLYNNICLICHQAEGEGNPATQIPPLAGSEWVNSPNPNRIIRIVLQGLRDPIQVRGQDFPGSATTMPPLGGEGLLDKDADLAVVLNFIRNSWGNHAAEVKGEQVAAVREKTKGRSDQWTAAELQAIPETE